MRPAGDTDDIPAVVEEAWRAVLGRRDLPADADFFELGGSSIHGARLMGELRAALDVPLPVQLIFFHPELAEFTTAVGDAARRIGTAPVGVSDGPSRPGLSLQQEELWVADQLEPGNLAYTELLPLRLDGPLDVPRLHGCVDRLVLRHDALRTRFPAAPDGTPHQEVPAALAVPFEVLDVADEDAARQVALDRLGEPFDLATGPLVRVVLLRLAEPRSSHVLLVYAHHIVADGLSLSVLCDELAALYTGRDLPEAASYAAYTRGQAGLDVSGSVAYWRDRLAGAAPVELPTDRPRPPVRSTAGRRLRLTVPGAVRDAADGLARECGATRFMVLLAAFHALLGRWAGADDVTVGSPMSSRSGPEQDRLVGYLVNMVALRGDTSGDPTFRELLARTREVTLGALANADVPFSRVVAELAPSRDRSRPPVFSATIIAQPTALTLVADLGDVSAASFPVPRRHCTYDLSLYAWDTVDELVLDLEYSTALYDEATVRCFGEQYRELLAAAVDAPDVALSALDTVPRRQRALLTGWNDTAAPFDPDTCLHRLVEAQALATPDRVAVVSGDRRVTYAELDTAADALARRLRAAGVGPDTVVAVRMPRSVRQLTALLAVWKAGGAYLPLDPAYPDHRVEFMLADSGAPLLLTDGPDGVDLHPCGDAHTAAAGGEPGPGPDNLAYVMYTSGTSGRPKGVMVPHRGIVNRVVWMQREYGLTADDVMLQNAAHTFDFSVWEFFGPLVLGAHVVLPDQDGHRDTAQLADLVVRHGVTTVHFVPSMLRPFLAEPLLTGATALRRVFSGGEALPADLAAEFHARFAGTVELHNLYGPTEASVDVTSWPVPPDRTDRVPIGRPVDNTTCQVLDERLRPLPIGVPGELCVGGVQLARGYLGRPGLTADRFVPDPFGRPGGRLYRTGDRVRRRADGAIEYLDRMDRQAKIRGFRVEPAEVEAALTAHPDVAEAAVVVQETHPGDRRLVAYCVLTAAGAGVAEVREFLAGRLPEHMLPAAYVRLPRLPVSSNGKLDRAALPEPPTDRPEVATGYEPPRGDRETSLAAMWSDVLGVERIGRDDSFFELGGDSILGIRMIALARRAGIEVTVPQLFRHQTIATLAEMAGDAQPAAQPAARPAARPADPASAARFPLTPLQRDMLHESDLAPGRGLYVVPAEALIDGDLDQDALRAAFTRLVAHHPILRTSVNGADHVVHPSAEPVFRFEDWRDIPAAEHERRRRQRIEDDWREGLDLGAAPLSRLSMVRLGERRHSLLWTRHNVLLDGWSFARLFDDLVRLHAALRDGRPEPALTAPEPFAGYVDWLGRRAGPAADALDAELLRDVRPARLFEPRPGQDAGPYREIRMPLPVEAERFVHRERLTLATMLEAAWAIVLARHTGTGDVRFGQVFSTRPAELPAIESTVGLLINTVPSALRVPTSTPVIGWLRELHERAVRMQELATASLPVLRQRHGPLWDTLLLLHNYPHGFDGTLPGDLELVDTQGFSQVGAALTVSIDPRPLRLALLFDPARAAEATVRELGGDLAAALTAMLADPDRPVGQVLR